MSSRRSLCGRFLLLLGLLLFMQNILQGQDREFFTAEVSVPPIQKLYIEDTKLFPAISASDYNKGYMALKDAVILSVSSNIPWRVVIYTHKVNLYVTPGKLKSIEHFQWRSGSAPFRSISSNPLTVIQGKAGVKDYKIVIDYRIKIGWKNTPTGKLDFQPKFRIEANYEGITR